MDGHYIKNKLYKKMRNLKLISQNIPTIYKEYDQRVIDFISVIVDDLEKDYKDIPASFRVNFDLLANVLTLYYGAIDGYKNKETERPIDKQRYYLQIMNCTRQIGSLCNTLGCDPMNKAKIKRLNKDEDESASELLDELMN